MQRLSTLAHLMGCLGLWAASLVSAFAQDPGFRVPQSSRPALKKQLDHASAAEALKNMGSLDDAYRLSLGDMISIDVLEDTHGALQVRVSPTGEAFAPYLGQVTAAGLTAKELASQLKGRLAEEKFFPDAHVNVSLDKLATDAPPEAGDCTVEFVVVFGGVAKTGKYDYPPFEDLTVSDLLSRAGGLTSSNRNPKIYIYRRTPQGQKRILVNTQAALGKKHAEYDLILRIDDIVIVTKEGL
jgi:protein involved in polysaccharide export with SLBB domain